MSPLFLVAIIAGLILAFGAVALFVGRRSVKTNDLIEAPPGSGTSTGPDLGKQASTKHPARMRERLGKARAHLGVALSSAMGRSGVDDAFYEELEEALVSADVSVTEVVEILAGCRKAARATGAKLPTEVIELVKAALLERMDDGDRSLKTQRDPSSGPALWLFVGVNGVGKTTTIGKLANRLTSEGKKVLLAGGDTFRAAAGEQLEQWAKRSGVEIVRGAEGADPASVIHDAIQASTHRGVDVMLADTAGRLHNKSNLMAELSKIFRVAQRSTGVVCESLLVLDATTGQNGLSQAAKFAEACELTGVVLTKMDGSAKGGIAFSIESQLGIPIKLIGLGEGPEDLVPFEPAEFVDALFASD